MQPETLSVNEGVHAQCKALLLPIVGKDLSGLLCRLISSSVLVEGRMQALVLNGSVMTQDRAVKQKASRANDRTSCNKFRMQPRDITRSTRKDDAMGGTLE
jgi:hypothetical protein